MLSKGRRQGGFTLVELAIVLVIIGLLLGMAMKGQQLIFGAKVKSLAQQFNKFDTANQIFYERYGQYPGDGCTSSNPTSISQCRGYRDGRLTSRTEYNAYWSALTTMTNILSPSDRDSVFGQDWNLCCAIQSYSPGGAVYDLPGGAQVDFRIYCAYDQKFDDGRNNRGIARASRGYNENTDCWQTNTKMDAWRGLVF